MAVTLVGEVANQCDSATGFGTGNVDTDIFVEPNASIGVKTSNATRAFTTTSLGAGAPYDFSSGGAEEGYHIIIWFNGLTPLNATAGMRIRVGNGTASGEWNVGPPAGYTGGFVSRVIDSAADFDTIVAGTWTTTGNPAQLTAVSLLGGVVQTTTSIMGNFNNALVDQFTVGLGARIDAGTVGTPNTFETLRAGDEDTNYWGWWTSRAGAIFGKGKCFIGPATGTATSVFNDSARVVIFESATVATGFYEIDIRGANTDVDLAGMVIAAEDPATARWSLTCDGTSVPAFDDDASLFQGFDVITLRSGNSLSGTTLDNGNTINLNGATMDACTVVNSAQGDNVAHVITSDLADITDCTFNFSDGHAIEIDTAGTYSFSGNIFAGAFGGTPGTNSTPSSGSSDAMILNSSGGLVTINISNGGTTPSIRNTASSTTTVNNNITLTITPLVNGSEVRIYAAGTSTEYDGVESSTGGQFAASIPGSTSVDIVVLGPTSDPQIPIRLEAQSFAVSQNLNPNQQSDRNFLNP